MTVNQIVAERIEGARDVFVQLGDNKQAKQFYARLLNVTIRIFENMPNSKRLQQMEASTDPEFLILLVEYALEQTSMSSTTK